MPTPTMTPARSGRASGARQPRVLHRHLGRGDGVLDEDVHLLQLLALDEALGLEVGHLARDRATARLEASKRVIARTPERPATSAVPVAFRARPERRDETDPRHHHPPSRAVRPCKNRHARRRTSRGVKETFRDGRALVARAQDRAQRCSPTSTSATRSPIPGAGRGNRVRGRPELKPRSSSAIAIRSARRSAPMNTGTITGAKRRRRVSESAAAQIEPAAALRLHDGDGGLEEHRHQPEGEREREPHEIRHAEAAAARRPPPPRASW